MAIVTNSNFDALLEEIQRLGDLANLNPLNDQTYQQFIALFPIDRLRTLTLNEYCIGHGDRNTFCWWIERGLQGVLGRYMPGTSKGHILYFLNDGSIYKNRNLQNLSDQEALNYTLQIQACIAGADTNNDFRWIDNDEEIYSRTGLDPQVTVSNGRKLRLLSCYHPNETIPISSSAHLGHFLKVLGCPQETIPAEGKPISRMILLYEYLNKARTTFPDLSSDGFMRALYAPRLGLAPLKAIDRLSESITKEPMDNKNNQTTPMTTSPLNQILYGPPGTGKTFGTVSAALEILDPNFLINNISNRKALKARFDQLAREDRVKFVTFHQSFSYEDFVEGLRAITDPDTGQLRYEIVDGVFKTLCQSASTKVSQLAEAPVDLGNRRIWKMSLGNTQADDSAVYDLCIENGYVLLGYGGTVDFTGCTSRAEVATRYSEFGYNSQNPSADYSITSITTFITKINIGDLVVISDGNFKFRAIGEVTGDYTFDLNPDFEGDYSQKRSIKWLRQYQPSKPLSDLMNNQFSQMTLYELRAKSINYEKLQNLLDQSVSSNNLSSPFFVGQIIGSNFKVTHISSEILELIKPNGNNLYFSIKMLNQLATHVSSGDISIEDIRQKSVFEKIPDAKLEPHIVNGYCTVLSNLIKIILNTNTKRAEPSFNNTDSSSRVLIIDEINRGNVSRIFGELITLLEADKRSGADEALDVALPYSKTKFSVPNNVYLIGTMNTADRSLTGIDIALRRRFKFKEMSPLPELLAGVSVGDIPIDTLLAILNQRIEALLDRDHCLGHAYFMPLKINPNLAVLSEIFRHNVIPLLQEYFFDDWQRISWVLNDHRKPESFQFLSIRSFESTNLFGEGVSNNTRTTIWGINDDAFLREESYLGIIDHRNATE